MNGIGESLTRVIRDPSVCFPLHPEHCTPEAVIPCYSPIVGHSSSRSVFKVYIKTILVMPNSMDHYGYGLSSSPVCSYIQDNITPIKDWDTYAWYR